MWSNFFWFSSVSPFFAKYDVAIKCIFHFCLAFWVGEGGGVGMRANLTT